MVSFSRYVILFTAATIASAIGNNHQKTPLNPTKEPFNDHSLSETDTKTTKVMSTGHSPFFSQDSITTRIHSVVNRPFKSSPSDLLMEKRHWTSAPYTSWLSYPTPTLINKIEESTPFVASTDTMPTTQRSESNSNDTEFPAPGLFFKIFMDYSTPHGNTQTESLKVKGKKILHRRYRNIRSGDALRLRSSSISSKDESSISNLSSHENNATESSEVQRESNRTLPRNESFVPDKPAKEIILTNKCIPTSSSCPDGYFECKSNSALCVPQSSICNGKSDCPDGSDEDEDCVNELEKNFWDNYFKKRPAADMDEEENEGNGGCLYITEELLQSFQSGKSVTNGRHANFKEFYKILVNQTCFCLYEKVFCHNVHLRHLQSFPEETEFLDLSGSDINNLHVPSGGFHQLKTLVLSSCEIREIAIDTFTSLYELTELHLTGNNLRRIPPSSFAGNGDLKKLFLGYNKLEALDSASFHGLRSLEYLDLRRNRLTGEDLHVFQSLTSLKTLHLNYNEIRYIGREFFVGLEKLDMLVLSKNKIASIAPGAFNHMPRLKHLHLSYNKLSVLENDTFCNLNNLLNLNLNDNGITQIEPRAFDCLCSLQSLILQQNPFRGFMGDASDVSRQRERFASLINVQHIYFDEWWMCWWAPHVRSCEPKGDGISSVENLLDNVILRVCVWIIGIVGVGGNLFVIISRLLIREKNKAHSFYINNLAMADLLMGIFLISIAFHDIKFRGHFLAHQHSWRHSMTCQLSGMLSTLSSEGSVFILVLITLDRYRSIVRPFAERTTGFVPAVGICLILWTAVILLISAPICPLFHGYFAKTFYTSNGLCLPLHIHNPYEEGWEYSFFLFIIINSVAFIFISFAYWNMLRIIQVSTMSIRSTHQKQDGVLVKRFGLVVFTDFLCWAPIIVFKTIAMAGVEIHSDLNAWLAVFVLPVNSALNPVIYTLSTKLFKQQVNSPGMNWNLSHLNNVSHSNGGAKKRPGISFDESTSSFHHRNRISKTMDTSLNHSTKKSVKFNSSPGVEQSSGTTRVTVSKEKMSATTSRLPSVGNSNLF